MVFATLFCAIPIMGFGVINVVNQYQKESFEDGLLEASQYTRPEEFMGMKVPSVLLSGHHKKIEDWRKYQSIKNTFLKRPDLLQDYLQLDEVVFWP